MKRVYYALVHSLLQYGTTLWLNVAEYPIRKLEILQKSLIKILLGNPHDYSNNQLLQCVTKVNIYQKRHKGKLRSSKHHTNTIPQNKYSYSTS